MSIIQFASGAKRSGICATSALAALLALGIGAAVTTAPAVAQEKKPNILFIMGDDIGWMQVVSYQGGLGLGETPNIDRIAMRAPSL